MRTAEFGIKDTAAKEATAAEPATSVGSSDAGTETLLASGNCGINADLNLEFDPKTRSTAED